MKKIIKYFTLLLRGILCVHLLLVCKNEIKWNNAITNVITYIYITYQKSFKFDFSLTNILPFVDRELCLSVQCYLISFDFNWVKDIALRKIEKLLSTFPLYWQHEKTFLKCVIIWRRQQQWNKLCHHGFMNKTAKFSSVIVYNHLFRTT